MADKVDNIMEHMLQEFQYYQQEEIFSYREIKSIVKNRRAHEYQMFRKDAAVEYFLDAVNFEKGLWTKKNFRKATMQNKPHKFDFQDHQIKRRIIYLYDRACRKYKQNVFLWKEYLNFLCKTRSMQKLNRVLSTVLQMHPTVIDFWLISVYTELDIKGNMFASRNLMLQAIRNNPESAIFYVEYFRFEVHFLQKIKQRQEILQSKPREKEAIDFVDEEMDNAENEEAQQSKMDSSSKILEIVLTQIKEKFPSRFLVYVQLWKGVVKTNKYVDAGFKKEMKATYGQKKRELLEQFVEHKVEVTPAGERKEMLQHLHRKYIAPLESEDERRRFCSLVRAAILSDRDEAEDDTESLYVLVKLFCSDLQQKLSLIESCFQTLSRDPSRLLDEINTILKQFEVEDDITAMVLSTKLNKQIQGDKFKLQKEFMIELEEISNQPDQDSRLCAEAKALIAESMLAQNQDKIAKDYIKRCLLKHSGSESFIETFFLRLSEVISSLNRHESIDFLVALIHTSGKQNFPP